MIPDLFLKELLTVKRRKLTFRIMEKKTIKTRVLLFRRIQIPRFISGFLTSINFCVILLIKLHLKLNYKAVANSK